MKRTISVVLVAIAVSACSSIPQVKGPFARAGKNATQTDAMTDDAQQPEVSPFPQQSGFGN